MMQFYFPNALHDFQYSLREQGKICIKLGTKHVTYQKLASFMWKNISLLTVLEVSSLACQHVFYRPEHNAKGEHGFEF